MLKALRFRRWAASVLATLTTLAVASMPVAASAAQPNTAAQADCPPDVRCEVLLAGLNNSGCNWSHANRPADLPVYGINEHTTDGGLQAALDEAQDTNNCISWNYLVDQTGKVWVAVPPNSIAYDVGNWWANTHYIQVEHVGSEYDCSTLTNAEYQASLKLDRYLIQRFHITPNSATITGHDSIPGTNDASMPVRHGDPGVCWPWVKFLGELGAPIVPTAAPNSSVVTIRAKDSAQPVAYCPGTGFTQCTDPAQTTTNFVALHTAPSTSAPLLSDPYLHPDSSAGSIAMQDWGDKAPTGHAYVVLDRKPGWTKIQYGGTAGWFQDNGHVSVPTTAAVVTTKGDTPVAIYGRPMPEFDAPGWASIPFDHQTQVALTKYSMQPGQRYTVAPVPDPRTDYAEGCNTADCTGPGDGTVVIGQTKYLEISWDHHFAFVKADDVQYVSSH